jgi:hypothetical protein
MTKCKWLPAVLVAVLPLAAGCSARQQANAGARASDQVSATHLNSAQAKTMVQDAQTGHQLAPNGIIPSDQQGKTFVAGQPVYVAFKVADAPVGSVVRVDWYSPADVKIGTEEKKLPAPTTTVSFAAPNTQGWNAGTYRAEIWIADQKADTEQFSITGSDSSTSNG